MERPEHRPRSKSGFSFKSEKSNSSKSPKEHLTESPKEKRRTHFSNTTKANPNAAMNEAQPVAAALEASTLGSLRECQHTDAHGNLITEPDLSNPTRPRWERPLDTIRSFERAIDGEYKRKSMMMRSESSPDVPTGFTSRRSSYYAGNDHGSRASQLGYYGAGSRTPGPRDSHGDPFGPPLAGPSRNRFTQRLQPELMASRYPQPPQQPQQLQQPYESNGYQQSRDTVNTGESGGSHSEPWGNSTDPSSENSSIDRVNPAPKPGLGEQYGFTGFGGAPNFGGIQFNQPIMEEYGNQDGGAYPTQSMHPGFGGGSGPFQQQQYSSPPFAPAATMGPPRVPPKAPIRLGGGSPQPLGNSSGNQGSQRPPLQTASSEKRKSWFKRRFSKD